MVRGGERIWQAEFISGEANMSHTLANLEHHHFKYPLFRRPGDVHVHFIGAAVLSFTAGVKAEPGDVFEIEVPAFGAPLRNPLGAGRVRGGSGRRAWTSRSCIAAARSWSAACVWRPARPCLGLRPPSPGDCGPPGRHARDRAPGWRPRPSGSRSRPARSTGTS